jgi:hypothetical protein
MFVSRRVVFLFLRVDHRQAKRSINYSSGVCRVCLSVAEWYSVFQFSPCVDFWWKGIKIQWLAIELQTLGLLLKMRGTEKSEFNQRLHIWYGQCTKSTILCDTIICCCFMLK